MALLNTAHVRSLLNPPAEPCISLYLPTHRGGGLDRRDDPIRFKKLVRRAEELLRARHPGCRVNDLLKPFEALILDTAFWTGTQDGLAVFGADNFFAAHRLPRTMPERVVVADSFHLKPLLRYTQSSVISETQLPVMSIGAPARGVAGGLGAAARCPWASTSCNGMHAANAALNTTPSVVVFVVTSGVPSGCGTRP